jgi:carboxyl-terminal processing protease
MPWRLALLFSLLTWIPAAAADRLQPLKTVSRPLDPLEAQNFAGDLLTYVIVPAAEQYVRPLSRADLASAALSGLYEAAHVPFPSNLKVEVDQAIGERDLLRILARVRDELGDREELKGHQALLAGVQGVTRLLDPFSGLTSGSDLSRQPNDQGMEFGLGLDVEPGRGTGPLMVKAVIPGSPAQRHGIRPGDLVLEIDGKSTEGLSLMEFQQRTGSNSSATGVQLRMSRIRLRVQSPGKASRKITLQPEYFHPETMAGLQRLPDNRWNFWVPDHEGIAYVRVVNLQGGSYRELNHIVEELQKANLQGLILDLRWCPGGWLQESEYVASLFLAQGTIASVNYRDASKNERFLAEGHGTVVTTPMVVLINGESSGGAELIAAALQDNHRAILVGQRSRGKASVQRPLPLPIPNVGWKLTQGTFNRPNGKNLHRFPDSKPSDDWGVRPDPGKEFRLSTGLSQLLHEWYLAQSLRPGSANDALPLDDPEADPQRRAALQTLLDTIPKR